MTDRLSAVSRTFALMISIFGCGDDAKPASGEPSSDLGSNDGSCALEQGTYIFTYSRVSGDCGDLADEVVVVQDGEALSTGTADGIECSNSGSCKNGSVANTQRCQGEIDGATVERRAVLSLDVNDGTGVLQVTAAVPSERFTCSSVYEVTLAAADAEGPSKSADASGAAGSGGTSLKLRSNGDPCDTDAECRSANCGKSAGGARYCYGDADVGQACTITQDCAASLCIDKVCTDPASLLPNGSICTADQQCESLDCAESVGGESFCYGDARLGDACGVTQDCAEGICRVGECVDPEACRSDGECAVNSICESGACHQVCGDNAFATDGRCECLPGFQWASADPDDPNCVAAQSASGCHLVGQDAQTTYLGEVGDCSSAASVCNRFGSYGSEYGSESIFNPYGSYGGEYAAYSAFNPYSTDPPLLVCNGEVTGCVTKNEFACPGQSKKDPSTLCSCK